VARLGLSGPLALDANCLSYLLLGHDPAREEKMAAAAREAASFGMTASALALAEVLVEPAKNDSPLRFERVFRAATDSSRFTLVPVDAECARYAATLRGSFAIKLPDATVIAAAVLAHADLLLSNDREVVRVAQDYLRAVYFDDWDPEAPEAG